MASSPRTVALAVALGVVCATSAAAQAPAVIPIPATAFLVETLRVAALPQAVAEKLEPVKSLAEAEAVLKAANIPFAWAKGEAAVARLGPDLTRTLAMLPPKEVFIIPESGGGIVIGVIIGRR